MDINNSTNISSFETSRLSKINLNSATRAFKQAKKELDNIETPSTDTKKEDISLMKTSKINNVNVEEIQKYANYMGENLSIDDINYGLMYGRSVIADYTA